MKMSNSMQDIQAQKKGHLIKAQKEERIVEIPSDINQSSEGKVHCRNTIRIKSP
jgi:Ser-tRNA(Ala) deacylase AlaX